MVSIIGRHKIIWQIFLDHLNSRLLSIEFIIDTEENGVLPFLHIEVEKKNRTLFKLPHEPFLLI